MANELAGQVAIVTGAGRGIGRATAIAFAQAGAAVTAMARTQSEIDETAALIAKDGGKAIAVAGDVTSEADFARVLADTESRLGAVDVLVSNAGYGGVIGPLWQLDPAEWRRCVEVNLVGPFIGARTVLPGMVARRRGRIINVSSGAALRPMAYDTSYTSSKAGLVRLTETLAVETKEHGVSCFVIGPGIVRTRLQDPIFNTEAGRKWMPHFGEAVARFGTTADVPAALCVTLASGAADALSGRYLAVGDDIPKLVASAAKIDADNLYTLKLVGLAG